MGGALKAKGNSPNIGLSLIVGIPIGVRTVSSALSVAGTSAASRPWAHLTQASPSWRRRRRSLWCEAPGTPIAHGVCWANIAPVRTADGVHNQQHVLHASALASSLQWSVRSWLRLGGIARHLCFNSIAAFVWCKAACVGCAHCVISAVVVHSNQEPHEST